jgi:hypothetical protein
MSVLVLVLVLVQVLVQVLVLVQVPVQTTTSNLPWSRDSATSSSRATETPIYSRGYG